VMVLYSISRSRRSRGLTDLYFNPPLDRVGLLQWQRFDRIVQRGYEHGISVLAQRFPHGRWNAPVAPRRGPGSAGA
jgi:NTE family protein